MVGFRGTVNSGRLYAIALCSMYAPYITSATQAQIATASSFLQTTRGLSTPLADLGFIRRGLKEANTKGESFLGGLKV